MTKTSFSLSFFFFRFFFVFFRSSLFFFAIGSLALSLARSLASPFSYLVLLSRVCPMAASFDPIEAKMRAAGLSDAAVSAFKLNFDALAGGESGMVRRKKEEEEEEARRCQVSLGSSFALLLSSRPLFDPALA